MRPNLSLPLLLSTTASATHHSSRDPSIIEFFAANLSTTTPLTSSSAEVYLATANRAVLNSKPCPALLPPVAQLNVSSSPRAPGVQVLPDGRGYRFFDPVLGEWSASFLRSISKMMGCMGMGMGMGMGMLTVDIGIIGQNARRGLLYDSDGAYRGPCAAQSWSDEVYTCTVGEYDDPDDNDEDESVVVWARAKMLYRCYVMLQHACPVGVDNGWNSPLLE
jgi:hypothetical protein